MDKIMSKSNLGCVDISKNIDSISFRENNSVAVLLSLFNGIKYIEELFDSLSAQTFKKFDIWIREDGSSVASKEIIDKYRNRLTFIFYEMSDNIGPQLSFFELLGMAGDRYDMYMFCDQDDIWLPHKIENAHDMICANTNTNAEAEPLLYFAKFLAFKRNMEFFFYPKKIKNLDFYTTLMQTPAPGCVTAINSKAREVLLSMHFPKDVMHDRWIFVVISIFGRIIEDNSLVMFYRIHDSNVVGIANSYPDQFMRRVRKMKNSSGGLFVVHNICRAIYINQEKIDNKEAVRFSELFLQGKKSLYKRFIISVMYPVKRQKIVDIILFKVLIILNIY
jgi:glycosyltransferase involved in cell wall biosynthesis